MRTGSGGAKWLLGDHLGSTSVSYDGTTPSRQGYYPWGQTRFGSLPTQYQFTGQYRTTSLGLDFFNARWLDPKLGRFIEADSMIPKASQGTQAWDRYAFVNNNPVRYSDPSGHDVLNPGKNGFSPLLPTNGYEVPYNPGTWNGSVDQLLNNCYNYALNQQAPENGDILQQPGESSGNPYTSYSADSVANAAMADGNAGGWVFAENNPNEACPNGTYRVALVIDPFVSPQPSDTSYDYHWYRQNPDGTWSHKPWQTPVTNKEAGTTNPKTITNPQNANRDYTYEGRPNYSEFGGYYCVGAPGSLPIPNDYGLYPDD